MADYTLSRTIESGYEPTVAAVRSALADQGFGVITEIDLAATLHTKLGVTVAPQLILGACRPQLAYEALQADPSIATVLPCNVVVRSLGATSTIVEAFDPQAMIGLSADAAADSPLATVADDARVRLQAMLAGLS